MTNTTIPPRRDRATLTGILLVLSAMMLFAVLDASGKYLGQTYPVVEITWARYFFHFLFVIMLVPKHGIVFALSVQRPWMQVVRAGFLLAVSLLSFFTLQYLPLADITAITAAAPLLVTAMSYFFLKEKIGPRRWIAVGIGMVGVLIIVRPGLGMMNNAAFLAIGIAVCYAAYQVITRWISTYDTPETTIFYTGLVGAVVSSAMLPFFWTTPTPEGWLLLILVGLLGGSGHYLLIRALKLAPASVVAQFTYSQLLWATCLGFVVFDDLPDHWTVAGATLIVAAGLYALYREAVHRGTA